MTTFIRKHKLYFICLFLYFIINGLFVLKYVSRTSLNEYFVLCFYCLFILCIIFGFKQLTKIFKPQHIKITYWIVIAIILCSIFGLHLAIDPYSVQVDRWSAIHNFIYNLFSDVYPYSARTHLGGYGSPFPIWQAFHIPFYLLGDVGIGMAFSFVVLVIFLFWFFDNYTLALLYVLLLAISPAFWYEVTVRSDLMYNFILCFITIAFLWKKQYSIQNNPIGLGFLCGLFLSTRFSVVVPFALFLFMDFYVVNIRQKILFVITILLVFIFSFLPLIFWNFTDLFFFKYNPFVLQTRQGSLLEVFLIVPLGIVLSFLWKGNFNKFNLFVAIVIIALICLTFIHRMVLDNFSAGLFDSAYDITYFNMALPFIIFTISTSLPISSD